MKAFIIIKSNKNRFFKGKIKIKECSYNNIDYIVAEVSEVMLDSKKFLKFCDMFNENLIFQKNRKIPKFAIPYSSYFYKLKFVFNEFENKVYGLNVGIEDKLGVLAGKIGNVLKCAVQVRICTDNHSVYEQYEDYYLEEYGTVPIVSEEKLKNCEAVLLTEKNPQILLNGQLYEVLFKIDNSSPQISYLIENGFDPFDIASVFELNTIYV